MKGLKQGFFLDLSPEKQHNQGFSINLWFLYFQRKGEQEKMKLNENEMNFSVPLEIIKASEIEPKEVKWLWYPYIPFGKVTLLQGDPGDGKSKLMLSIAALLSKGEPIPFTETE
ncbi:AAA family ATPase, partial [Clostridioides difficile]